MKIHETDRGDGSLASVFLVFEDGTLFIDGLPLVDGALRAVMKKFGRPLETSEKVVEVARMEIGDAVLRHVRHLARYDVIARDFLVYEVPGEEPLCALAVTVSGALTHLARAGL